MKFSEMPYSRPDVEKLTADFKEIIEKLNNAATFEEADELFAESGRISAQVDTAFSIAYVRHSIDTRDEFYDKEIEFLDETSPVVNNIAQDLSKALYESKFRPQFAEKYGELMFKNIEIQLKAFSPEIIPEMQEENKLTTEYDKLIASAQIPFEGEDRTLSQLTPFKQVVNDEKRMAAWKAEGGFYVENAQKLDDIYDKLVHLRDKMAKKMGYKNYIELGYYRMMRNSYTAKDVDRFREAVRKYIVPIADQLYREQAKRTGLRYPLNFADAVLTFRSGNPVPQGSPDDILAHGKKFYHELSKETAEFIDFMYDNELLDVLSRTGKSGGGYCTAFPLYKSPFIFANFNGTAHDVEVITHEAGHAFAAFTARDIFPMDNQSPTLESCEVHSMSMEFFAWPYLDAFFPKAGDAERYRFQHALDALSFLPYGTMVDEFQHRVYAEPDLTPAERNAVWLELEAKYRPYIDQSGIPYLERGTRWQYQMHIYETPFYYIDYCLAQTAAFQFLLASQDDYDDAFARYLHLSQQGGEKLWTDLLAEAGFRSPFEPGALAQLAARVEPLIRKHTV